MSCFDLNGLVADQRPFVLALLQHHNSQQLLSPGAGA